MIKKTKKRFEVVKKRALSRYLGITYPYLIIDEVTDHEYLKKAETRVFLKPERWYFKSHFTGNPVMPGHLIAEAMVQTCSLLFGTKDGDGRKEKMVYMASSRVNFLRMVKPGGVMRITVKPVKVLSFGAITSGKAYVRGKLVAKGEFSSRIINTGDKKWRKRK